VSVLATNLGFPRVGLQRELKKALEGRWNGQTTRGQLLATAAELRARHWRLQKAAGLAHIPSNDFSLYDHILDLTCLLGNVPKRYGWNGGPIDLDTYFAMARGRQVADADVTAMEMSKWFDTNYHYLVPEFDADPVFELSSTKIFDEYREAKALGIETRPVIVGPLTYAALGKTRADAHYCRSTLLPKLTPVYVEVLRRLQAEGAAWIQIDEPALALDLEPPYRDACVVAYRQLAAAVPGIRVLLTTYFDGLRDNAGLAFSLPVAGIHLDLCRGTGQANTPANDANDILGEALEKIGDRTLSLGVVDGRNVWRNDLRISLARVSRAVGKLGADKVFVAPSCSLLHSPVDLRGEERLPTELAGWLAFATQKLDEIAILARGANAGAESIRAELRASEELRNQRRNSELINDLAVQRRLAAIDASMKRRRSDFETRNAIQRPLFQLPDFPTTTIGSFPQTEAIRKARAGFRQGTLDAAGYERAMRDEIRTAIDRQERIGLDVLVHGEPERNDMVEYFGEQLKGFAFTQNGWVQSYGSRCVKPPIIYGDVSRPKPMTVEWAKYAQSLTGKVVKGMLTGPITILQWSFVRDDQPRWVTSRQIALAIRAEVSDLERAGIRMIQIDEAALREGLPLRQDDWQHYLDWAVECFRITAAGARPETQVHTHMCYSEFSDIFGAISDLDADVISIENARSGLELLEAFREQGYDKGIGPGVYDIHSPRVPPAEEIAENLKATLTVLGVDQVWVNPDCGLKTRKPEEATPALKNMVAAAKQVRESLVGAQR
jgi:5-methyltetrahydropteroyltriglutamate--homocysteine methyltransferase